MQPEIPEQTFENAKETAGDLVKQADEKTNQAVNNLEPDKTSGEVFEETQSQVKAVLDKADEKENKVLNAVDKVQNVVSRMTPVPTDFEAVSSPSKLKARLDWGEPALSIVDVRDRKAFNYERIMGAISMPISELVKRAQSSFESNRDIYICGDSNEQAFEAATQLQSAGFERVSTIDGGLPAWKAIGGSIEGQTNAGPTRGQLLP